MFFCFSLFGATRFRGRLCLGRGYILNNYGMSWLVSVLARRYYYTAGDHYNYNNGSMFDMIAKGFNPFKNRFVPTDKAIYLKSMLKVGRQKLRTNKQILKPYCNFPGADAIRKREEEIRPTIKDTLNGGVKFDMAEVMPLHVKGILENLALPIETLPSRICAKINFGFDGSGGLLQWLVIYSHVH